MSEQQASPRQERVLGVVRHILTFAGGYAVAKGYIDEANIEAVIGAVITVVGTVWSILAKKKSDS